MTPNTIAPRGQNKTPVQTGILLAADLCRIFEGYRSKPYLCPAGVWTIGYGSTRYPDGRPVKITDRAITKDQADNLLIHGLDLLAPAVLLLCPGLSGNRLAAILDFAYNLGIGRLKISTLRKRINARDWHGARLELSRWTKGGGRVLPGLVKRRSAEAGLL